MLKISVIIPAYNAERFIEQCLLALHQQTVKGFEIIVVDDCSTDRTFEIASRYAKVIQNKKNSGAGWSRNIGVKASYGELLAFTDADVIVPSEWLQNIIETLRQTQVECVGGGYLNSQGSSFIQRFAHFELEFRRKHYEGLVTTAVSNNLACYRKVFFNVGGFPKRTTCDDLQFTYKISRKYKIFWNKDNRVLHHFRDNLRGYLKQQYDFSRDSFLTYYKYPKLLRHETHQGRSIYLEVTLAFIFLCLFLVSFFISEAFLGALGALLGISFINIKLLIFLHSKGVNCIKSFTVILLRDFWSIAGVFVGFFRSGLDLLTRGRTEISRLLKQLKTSYETKF